MRRCSGQAMVEAAGTLGLLLILFMCIVHTFQGAVGKLRSLDTVYHLARVRQVNRGPAVHDIIFRFRPHGLARTTAPWTSVMRFSLPEEPFLNRSWPGAPEDRGPNVLQLTQEKAAVQLRLQPNHDTPWEILDAID